MVGGEKIARVNVSACGPGRCRTGSDGPLYQNNILAGDMVETCNCSGHGLHRSNLYVDR